MPEIPVPDEVIEARSKAEIQRAATFKKLGTTEKFVHTTKKLFLNWYKLIQTVHSLKFPFENSLEPPIPQIVTPPFAKQKNHKNAHRPIMKLGDEFPKYTYSCHWDYVDDFFNIKNTICCDSTLYKKSAGNACCGNEIYSKRKQFCCWNPNFPKIGELSLNVGLFDQKSRVSWITKKDTKVSWKLF